MQSGQLPQIKLDLRAKRKLAQDENAAVNRLLPASNRDKISFKCLSDFLQMRIRESRNKNQNLSKIMSFGSERTDAERSALESVSAVHVPAGKLEERLPALCERRDASLQTRQRVRLRQPDWRATRSSTMRTCPRNVLSVSRQHAHSFKESPSNGLAKRTSIRLAEGESFS